MANKFNGRWQVFGPAGTNYSTLFQPFSNVASTFLAPDFTTFTVTYLDGTSIVYGGTGLSEAGGILSGSITSVTIKDAGAVTLATMTSLTANEFLIDGGASIYDGSAFYDLLLSGANLIVGSANGTAGTHEVLAGGTGNDIYQPGNGFTTISDGGGISTLDVSGAGVPASIDLLNQTFTFGGATGSMSGVTSVIGTTLADTILGGADGTFDISAGAGNDTIDAFGQTFYGALYSVDAGAGDDTVNINTLGWGLLDGGTGHDTLRALGDIRFYSLSGFERLDNLSNINLGGSIRAFTEQLQYLDEITNSNLFNGGRIIFQLENGGTVDFGSMLAPGLTVNVETKVGGTSVLGGAGVDNFLDSSTGIVDGLKAPNFFYGGGGNDTFTNNNSGNAITFFSGNAADYTIHDPTAFGTQFAITDNRPGSPDGTDTLVFYFNGDAPVLAFADQLTSFNAQRAGAAPPVSYNGVFQMFGPDNFDYAQMFPGLSDALSESLAPDGTTYTVDYRGGIQVVFGGTGLTTSGQFTPSGGFVDEVTVFDTSISGSPIELAHFFSEPGTNHVMKVPFTTDIMTGGERVYQQLLFGNNHIIGSANNDFYTADIGHNTVDFGAGADTVHFGLNVVSVDAPPFSSTEPYVINFVDGHDSVGFSFPDLPSGTDVYSFTIDVSADVANRAAAGENIVNRPLPSIIKALAGLAGDPHVTTADGVNYDYQGAGEFILAKSTLPGDTFEIQGRLSAVAVRPIVSVLEQAAAKVGTHIVTFDYTRNDIVWVDGLAADFLSGPLDLGAGTLSLVNSREWTISYDTGEKVTVDLGVGLLNLTLDTGPDRAAGTLHGLFGNFDGDTTNEFELPNGTILQRPLSQDTLYNIFADSWRVTQGGSLLDYGPGETTGTFTNEAIPATFSLADLPSDVLAKAEALVNEAGISDPGLRASAMYDYIVLGDTSALTYYQNLGQLGVGTRDTAYTADRQTLPGIGVIAAKSTNVEASTGNPTSVTFEVFRTGPPLGNLIIDFAVVAPDANHFDAASFGGVLPSGQVTILDGQSTASFTIDIPDGSVTLASEFLRVQISNASNLPVLAPTAETEVINNGPASGAAALPEFVRLSGGGTLTHVGNTWTLDLGTFSQDQVVAPLALAIANQADSSANALSGMFDMTGSGFDITGASTFLRLAGGGLQGGIGIEIDLSLVGSHTQTLTLQASESNKTGYSNKLGDQFLVIKDTVTGSGVTKNGLAGADTLAGTKFSDTLNGLAGNDTLIGLGAGDTLDGGTGIDTASYTAAAAAVIVNLATGIATGSDAKNDTFINIENVTGSAQGDTLTGNSGANALTGLAGNDTIDGGVDLNATIIDKLIGGLGNDTYLVRDTKDSVTEAVNQGTDTVQSSAAAHTLSANVDNLVLLEIGGAINGTGNALNNVVTGNSFANVLSGGGGIDVVSYANATGPVKVNLALTVAQNTVGAGTDKIAAFENLIGSGFADTLTGSSIANVIDGGLGGDTMAGGLGNDTYIVDNAGDVVTEITNQGTDTVVVKASGPTTFELSIPSRVNIENVTYLGSAGFTSTGNALANVIKGGSGTDILSGAAGNDRLEASQGAADAKVDVLTGGDGNDVYVVFESEAVDKIVENLGALAGIDSVESFATGYALLDNVENLTIKGGVAGTARSGTGNGLANIVLGDISNDTLDGGADSMADQLKGGKGNDTYIVRDTNDKVTELASQGTDTVETGITLAALAANLENLVLTGTDNIDGTGNTLANVLTGNSGDNILNGMGGLDTASYAAAGGAVTVDLTLSGGQTTGAGSDTLIGIENLTGSANDDKLTGNASANVLNGGAGKDTMDGGAGNDTYVVDNADDSVNELAGSGTDTVQSSLATYTLTSDVENLVLTGTGNIAGTGNAGANTITGNIGNNTLDGGSDSAPTIIDLLKGGKGDDIYIVVNLNDKVTELANEGKDTVKSSVTYTLGLNVEDLELQGVASNGTGNTLANTMTGNANANLLSGLTGNDTLIGGGGADTLNGGMGTDSLTGGGDGDVFLFNTALTTTGIDVIVDFDSGTDKIHLENAIFTKLGAGPGLAPGAFALSTDTPGTDDRITYNAATGALVYDSNGSLAGGQTQFAILTGAPTLTAGDFVIV